MAQVASRIWEFADAADRNATGSDHGLRTGQLGYIRGESLSFASGVSPTSSTWVAAVASTLDWKSSVRVATTTTLPANTRTGNVLTADANGALPAIDGVSLSVGNSLLVKDEAVGANRGIYEVTNLGSGGSQFVLTRRSDADSSDEVTNGLSGMISEGTLNGGKRYLLVTADPITLNTTSLTFDVFPGSTPPLADVLAEGNVTGGNDIEVTSGDEIVSASGSDLTLRPASGRALVLASGSLLVGGAASTDPTTSGDDFVLGNLSNANPGMTMVGTTAAQMRIQYVSAAGVAHGEFRYDRSQSRYVLNIASADRYLVATGAFSPVTDNSVDLGIVSTGRFRDAHLSRALLLAGATQAAAPAGSDEIVIGDGSAADFGTMIFTGTAAVGTYGFTDTSGSSRAWTQYNHATDLLIFGAGGADRIAVGDNVFRPTTDAGSPIGVTSSHGWQNLVLTERADHVGAPTATRAEIWLRNDAPNVLVFTDDAGADHPLGYMEILHGGAKQAFLPAASAASFLEGSSGIAGRAILQYSATATNSAYWRFVMPREYVGGDLVLRIWYSGSSSFGGTDGVRWSVGFERQNSLLDMSATSFGTFTNATDTPGVTFTAELLRIFDITVSAANLDGILAGESFMVTVDRLGADGADTYTGTTRVYGVALLQ